MAKQDLPSPELLRKLLRYEPETGKLFWRVRDGVPKWWNTKYAGKEAFVHQNINGYCCGNINNNTYVSHRVIWAMFYNYWPRDQIDHINGVKTDNRIKNLRDVVQSKNQRNRTMNKNNTSGYNGIYWDKNSKKWTPRIRINGKMKRLGSFKNIEDAIAVRKLAEVNGGYTKRHGKPC